MDESGTDDAECRKELASERKVVGAIRFQINAMGLQFECARGLHQGWVVPILLYVSETMIWREKERFAIRAV